MAKEAVTPRKKVSKKRLKLHFNTFERTQSSLIKYSKAKQKRIALEQPEDLSVIETTEDNVSVLPLKDDADDESNTFTNIEREDCFSGMVADEKENIMLKQKQRLSNNNSYIKQCKIALQFTIRI